MGKSIIETYPNARGYGNEDKQLSSKEDDFRLEFTDLNEIAMAALDNPDQVVSDSGEPYSRIHCLKIFLIKST